MLAELCHVENKKEPGRPLRELTRSYKYGRTLVPPNDWQIVLWTSFDTSVFVSSKEVNIRGFQYYVDFYAETNTEHLRNVYKTIEQLYFHLVCITSKSDMEMRKWMN